MNATSLELRQLIVDAYERGEGTYVLPGGLNDGVRGALFGAHIERARRAA